MPLLTVSYNIALSTRILAIHGKAGQTLYHVGGCKLPVNSIWPQALACESADEEESMGQHGECSMGITSNRCATYPIVSHYFSYFVVFHTLLANLTLKCLPKQGGMPAFFCSLVFFSFGFLDASGSLFEVIFARGVPPRALESSPCRPCVPE